MSSPSKNLFLFPENGSFPTCDPFLYESLARKAGYELVAGVDEAGRGPLAGPVVAAAVMVPECSVLEGVRDSKKMSEKAREEVFSAIQREALSTGIGVVSQRYIDEHNILRASLEAMRAAVLCLDPKPGFLLVDGIHSVPLSLPQRCLKRGDQMSRTIGAASVLAKVYRDRIMRAYHEMYPVYGFNRNKGYGTLFHLNAIRTYGACPFHRRTFRGVRGFDEKKASTWEAGRGFGA